MKADSQCTMLYQSVVCIREVMSFVLVTVPKALKKTVDIVTVLCGGLSWFKLEATVCEG